MNLLLGFRNLETDPEKAAQLLKHYRLYPYAQRDNPPATRYLEVGGKTWSGMPPRGLAYWARLSDILNREPVQERDRIMMAMLRSIGIEKGKPFNPDERQKTLLTEGALVGEAMAKANDFDKRQMELSHYADGVQWHLSLCLDVAITYRLHVPANAPVRQFWSLTVYDVSTRCLIDNKEQLADRSSRQPDLMTNADGSVDLYVGPKAPAGFENNWIPSVPGRAWFPYLRLYTPTEAHFKRSWILPDLEKVS